jgi:hypothetical protein
MSMRYRPSTAVEIGQSIQAADTLVTQATIATDVETTIDLLCMACWAIEKGIGLAENESYGIPASVRSHLSDMRTKIDTLIGKYRTEQGD